MEVAEYEQLVNELEMRVDRLRSLYDQYFMGIEKTIPAVPHKDVDRRIQFLRREQVRNTGIRFRFQMIVQRYNTYQTYWQRICRQIEEGTYKRHVQKAKEKIARQAAAKHESGGYDIDIDFEMEMMELEELGPGEEAPPPEPEPIPAAAPIATAPAAIPRVGPVVPPGARQTWKKVALGPPQGQAPAPAPAPPVAAPAPAPAPAKPAPAPAAAAPAPKPAPKPAAAAPPAKPAAPPSPGDLSDARKRELYARYVETKRSRGESTVGITFESLSQTLRDSGAKLREKHGKNVDFEVTVKDGKTILKPVLK